MVQGLGGFQEMSQLAAFSEITKYQAHVCSPKRMAEFTNRCSPVNVARLVPYLGNYASPRCPRCFHYAVLERGPTQLNIPRDMFYGDLTTAIPKPTPVERSAGGPAALAQAAQLLAAARNPVIISGGGVVMAGGVDQVVELAETCQVRGG